MKTLYLALVSALSLVALSGCDGITMSVDRTAQSPETLQIKKSVPMYTQECTNHTEYGSDPSCGTTGGETCTTTNEGPNGAAQPVTVCTPEYASCPHTVSDCHDEFQYNSNITVTLHFDPAAPLKSDQTEKYTLTTDSGTSGTAAKVSVSGSSYKYDISTDVDHPINQSTGKFRLNFDPTVNLDLFFKKK